MSKLISPIEGMAGNAGPNAHDWAGAAGDGRLNSVKHLVADMSADDIRRNQKHLHQLLQKLDAQIPLIQSIWIYDPDGRPLVTSWMEPAPTESFADRDFIRAHQGSDSQTHYGQVYESQDAFAYSEERLRAEAGGCRRRTCRRRGA